MPARVRGPARTRAPARPRGRRGRDPGAATAGTIFHGTRTPLTVWFAAGWHLVSGKVGVSAIRLQREMQLGSYQTAWAMLHRYRSVMVRPGRERLTGEVEVDESYIGGPEAGIPGRGALGKVLFAAAVEREAPRSFGRARVAVIEDASAPSLRRLARAPAGRTSTSGRSASTGGALAAAGCCSTAS